MADGKRGEAGDTALYFELFNEIGILAQLSRALFEARLPEGLTVPHFSVLNHLVRLGDGATPLALARAFQVPKTTMTHTLSGLEARGLVELAPNPRDGRSKLVRLTPAGRRFRDDAIASLAGDLAEVRRRFPRAAVERILPDLAMLRAEMDRMRDG